MAEALNVSTVSSPKTLTELAAEVAHRPTAVLAGGCTQLMSRDFRQSHDLIDTSKVFEFTRVYRGERYFEAGSAITIQQLITAASYILSNEVITALKSIATSVIRSRATIGGCLCTKGTRYALSCILSALDAICEIKTISAIGRSRRVKITNKWIPVAALYKQDGSLVYGRDVVISKIRIPYHKDKTQAFYTLGQPKTSPSSSVIVGIQYKMNQSAFSSLNICVVYPKDGFICSNEFDTVFSSLRFPVSLGDIAGVVDRLTQIIPQKCPGVSKLQLERTKRLFTILLYKLDTTYLAG